MATSSSPKADLAVPLLVLRAPAIERTAWRAGRAAAYALERRVADAFATAAEAVLRGGDRTQHEPGSDVFVAVLHAPGRDGTAAAVVDIRSALARIAATVEGLARTPVETGWTAHDPAADLGAAVERALATGARERERYAFFSAVGHELRTPLASIRGYLETLLEAPPDLATARRFLQIAHGESLRMSRLLEGMFEISLLDLHASFPRRSHGALDAAVDAALDACAGAADARAVRIIAPEPSGLTVAIDADRLTLVLINLVDNATKHGRPGGLVRIAVDDADPRIAVVTIDDDGPGIPPEDREQLFAFGARGTTFAPGSGIGLALVRLMLERVGGRVSAGESALGGASFRLELPRR